ncbi:MAG TPA: hypothetical protein VFD57_03635 [Clostridia bacterium]|nr:hypothetical protein [Clostridia bacterium]
MLELNIESTEVYNEETNEFLTTKPYKLLLEHSLLSISKWEMIHEKPFLTNEKKTSSEMIDYIKCMTITQNVGDNVYKLLTRKHLRLIDEYIDRPMTATVISKSGGNNKEIVTSEIIYYWMISLGIPFECQKWHFKRLLTLINVCSIKTNPGKKMTRSEIMERNRILNRQRKAKLNTKG